MAPPGVGHSHAGAVFLMLNKPSPCLLCTSPLNLEAQEVCAFCHRRSTGQVGGLCNQLFTQVSWHKLKMKRHLKHSNQVPEREAQEWKLCSEVGLRSAGTVWVGSTGGSCTGNEDGGDGGVSLRTNTGCKEWAPSTAGKKRTQWAGGILRKASQVTCSRCHLIQPLSGDCWEGICRPTDPKLGEAMVVGWTQSGEPPKSRGPPAPWQRRKSEGEVKSEGGGAAGRAWAWSPPLSPAPRMQPSPPGLRPMGASGHYHTWCWRKPAHTFVFICCSDRNLKHGWCPMEPLSSSSGPCQTGRLSLCAGCPWTLKNH